jgi:hypothetical protein
MQNAAREGNGSFDSVPDDPAPETAYISPESENRSEMGATVATVAAVGSTTSAFEAALLPGMVLRIAAIWVHFPANRTKSPFPEHNSRHQVRMLEMSARRFADGGCQPRRERTASWPADSER